jgi:hypothetical protein
MVKLQDDETETPKIASKPPTKTYYDEIFDDEDQPVLPKKPSKKKEKKDNAVEIKVRLDQLYTHLSRLKMNGKTGLLADLKKIMELLS